MCESCVPENPERVDPETMKRFRETLKERGIDPSDPAAWNPPEKRVSTRLQRLWFGLNILFGRA